MAVRFSIHKVVLASSLLVFAMGHGGGGCCSDEAEEVLGPSTETQCPPTSTLTYASFGQPFMTSYCTRCHSSTLTGADRMGAPAFHDFDTQIGIQQVADHVDQVAGSGPAATNESMPPDGAKPTLDERKKLAEWIACGAP
ncbi:MAG: hypothetical protein HOV81_20120 [Kofleriaceae bacterium]|nr:hypothetical protein [Kofleriaceae bacterium]